MSNIHLGDKRSGSDSVSENINPFSDHHILLFNLEELAKIETETGHAALLCIFFEALKIGRGLKIFFLKKEVQSKATMEGSWSELCTHHCPCVYPQMSGNSFFATGDHRKNGWIRGEPWLRAR
jgi:hypothetical protein